MDTELVALALANFKETRRAVANYRERTGQTRLVQAIAETLAGADFAENAPSAPQLLVAEAGTGTGKTAAFVPGALTIARAKGVRLVVSTATVALMEQLVNRDLPAMASTFPGGFTFGLAKGRGRYFCPAKADTVLGEGLQDGLDLDDNNPGAAPRPGNPTITLYRTLAESFESGQWNGDKDDLGQDVSASDWSTVAADRASCTGRHCGHFRNCPYYNNKRKLVKADVIVTNHDLLLSSLVHGSGIVPTPDKAAYVLDEAHHLAAIAVKQAESEADISSPRWPTALTRATALAGAAGLVQAPVNQTIGKRLSEALINLQRGLYDVLRRAEAGDTFRFAHGTIDPAINEMANETLRVCADWQAQCLAIVGELKDSRDESNPKNDRINRVLVDITTHQRYLDELHGLLTLFVNESATQSAKWVSRTERQGRMLIRLHACPLSAAPTLRNHLWKRARGIVLTSATFRTLGSFDYLLRQCGLRPFNPRTEVIDGPFDYSRQGQIIVSKTAASPSVDLGRFVKAMIPQLFEDLSAVRHGALVLFSSRSMMEQVVKALPQELAPLVLVQGTRSRDQLLASHRQRIAEGKVSILMGLASFGTGLDLPSEQCESVHVPKLPFPMPTTPVEEARAEAISARGGNPFLLQAVPATGLILTQWAGRGIRTESDTATIFLYDPRLVDKSYGKALLDGLPPFPRKLRLPGGSVCQQ